MGYEKEERQEDRHYGLYTEHHLRNHLKFAGFNNIKTELFQQPFYKGKLRKLIGKIINWIFMATPLKRMSFMHIKAVGFKTKRIVIHEK